MAKGTRWPSAHAGYLAALICRRWRGYQHRQELSPWLHPNNKALSWLEATTGQWPFPRPDATFFTRQACHLAPRACAKIMVCFNLSRSQSRRFRPPGSSRSRWELILLRDVSFKNCTAVIPSWQTFLCLFFGACECLCVFIKGPILCKIPLYQYFPAAIQVSDCYLSESVF